MRPLDRFWAWADAEGPTRAAGLLRIALAVMVLVRFAEPMGLYQAREFWQIGVSLFFFAATGLMLIGLWSRAATAATAATLWLFYFHYGHGGVQPTWTSHHVYILTAGVTLCALAPCGRSLSVDRWRALARGPATETGPLWAMRLIQVQMAALYLWTAIDKTGAHFLSGDRLESILIWAHMGRPMEAALLIPGLPMLGAVAVVIVEYALVAAILIPRWWRAAVLMAAPLHVGFYLLLPVNTYSATMLVLYLAVIPPETVRAALDRLQAPAEGKGGDPGRT